MSGRNVFEIDQTEESLEFFDVLQLRKVLNSVHVPR